MTSETEQAAWSSAQLGQMLDDANPEDLKSIRQSGILPEKVAGILAQIENDYDPSLHGENVPTRAEYTEKYQKVVSYWASRVLSKAVHNGHDRVINRFIGVVEGETSINGVQAMVRFLRWVTREAGVTYLTGHMGTGKTDFALLMAQVFYEQLKESDRDVHIATNIKSCAENHEQVEFIDSQPELKEWLEEKDGYKFFVFDESSSHASGYAGDSAKVTKQFRSMIRLIRKHDGNIVCIGHDGKDLHPTIRELADYVEKDGKKDAAVFEGVEDRQGEDRKFDISEIPKTNWYYDTKEASSWSWATESAEGKSREYIMGEIYVNENMTQATVAEYFEVSQSKVSKAKKVYMDEKPA